MKVEQLELFAIQFAKENPNWHWETLWILELTIDKIKDGNCEIIECNQAKKKIIELLNH